MVEKMMNEERPSPNEITILRTLFGTAFEAIGTALSTILKVEVKVTPPEIKTASPDKIRGKIGQAMFLGEFSYRQPFSDSTYLLLEKKAGAIVADLMMGGDGTSPPDEINELYLGAVGEVMSQMMNSAVSALSSLTGSEISVSSPKVRLVDLSGKIDLPLFEEESLVEASSKMNIGGLEKDALLIQLISISLSQSMTSAKKEPTFHPGAIHPVQFAPLKPSGVREVPSKNIDFLINVPMQVSVELGRISMPLKDILQLGTGSVIELDRLAGEPVDVLVNGKLIAKGNVVVIEEKFGLRITNILNSAEKLGNLKESF